NSPRRCGLLPWLHPTLAQNRKGNSEPQRGTYLRRRNFHSESWSSRSGRPIGCPLSIFRWNHRQSAEREITTRYIEKRRKEMNAATTVHTNDEAARAGVLLLEIPLD